MKKENFERLKESIVEAGKILRGELPPSREFTYEAPESPEPTVRVLAVCVETDDEALLVRPDGYVAWSGGPGLGAALAWCGVRRPPQP